MMRSYSFLYFVLFLSISSVNAHAVDTPLPIAKDGVIDLSDWNFEADGVVKLNGQWEFYWLQFLTNQEIQRNSIASDGFLGVPNKWNGFNYQGEEISGDGYGTYRIIVKLPANNTRYAAKLPSFATAYKLFIDGHVVAKNGVIGKTKESMTPRYRPQVIILPEIKEDRSLVLVLQVSNFYHRKGGVWEAIEFGSIEQIYKRKELKIIFDLFLLGSFLVMAVYHFGLYILRRKDPSAMYFGLLCIVVATRILMVEERFITSLMTDYNWEVFMKIEYLSYYLAVLTFLIFIHSIYREEYTDRFAKPCIILVALFSLSIVFLPAKLFTYTAPPFQVLTAFAGIWVIQGLIKAVRRKKDGAISALMGFPPFFAAVMNDILRGNEVIQSPYYFSAGLFIFIFSQSFILSLRYSKALAMVESLSANLQQQVLERTNELHQTLVKLKDNHSQLVDAQAQIMESIRYASGIQRSILPTPENITETVSDCFIHWEPRDIVGGDIYWLRRWGSGHLLTMIDCTGHGVPGAFMTLIARGALDLAILQVEEGDPAKLINKIHQLVQATLAQEREAGELHDLSDDGLELGICYIHPDKKQMTYSGARFSLFEITDNGVNEIKGDKCSIGYRGIPIDKVFSNHIVKTTPGAHFYLTTDGLIDQIGGKKLRGFGKKRFRQLLLAINNLPMPEQKQRIIEAISDYQGQELRRDDLSVIGFTI